MLGTSLLQGTLRQGRNLLVKELLRSGPDWVVLPVIQSKKRWEEVVYKQVSPKRTTNVI